MRWVKTMHKVNLRGSVAPLALLFTLVSMSFTVAYLKNSFSQSFGSMSKEIAKDMTGALTKVDEKVGVFNRQVSELNKSQDNFSKILSGVKTYGTLAEFGLGALLKDLLPSSQFIANVKMKEDTSETVEFAIKLQDVLLPIDSHWPVEKYKAIDDAQDEIRYQLASKIKNQVRRIPEILFYEDDTAEYVNKMERLFKKAREGRADSESNDTTEKDPS